MIEEYTGNIKAGYKLDIFTHKKVTTSIIFSITINHTSGQFLE